MTTEQAARPKQTAAPRKRVRARAADVASAEQPLDEARSLSGDVVGARVTRIEWMFYGAFTIIGALMRLWDLGSRALHHDESLHATYSWYLWEWLTGTKTVEYHYDPMMHGPYQFHGNALMYLIFGVNNTSARLDAALCGTALIILPILLRRQLGRVSALVLSGLLAFSPAFLYYSRFTREDIYFALWTALFFVGFIRWLDARGHEKGYRWLYVAAAGFALSWATKESTYFTLIVALGFVIGVFAVGYAYQFLAPARTRGRRNAPRENAVVAALGDFSRANLPPLVAAFRGTPARAWWYSLGIMAVITFILFLPVGNPWQWGFIPGAHPQGTTNAQNQSVNYNTDFLTGGLSYWKLQQDVQRGGQPWYYYFLVIPLYEQVAVVFGLTGLVYYFWRGRPRPSGPGDLTPSGRSTPPLQGRLSSISGVAWVLLLGLTLFVGPRLSKPLHYLLALLMILAFVALMVSRPRALLLNLALWWTAATWALYVYAGEKMPWLTLHLLLPLFVVAALYIGQLFQARRFSPRWIVTAVLLALTALVSLRSSMALAYVDGANPTEMLIYTQTSQDVPTTSAIIHKIPLATITTGAKARVWVDNNDTWPWVWYLHDDPSYHGLNSSAESDVAAAAQQRYPVVIVSDQNHGAMAGDGKLAQFGGYTGYKFKLRWWFPEDGYKAWATTGLSGFLGDALRPATWGNIGNWWATRTPFDQQVFKAWLNVYPFYVYVRNDMVKGYVPASWNGARQLAATAATGAVAAPTTNDVAASLARPLTPRLVVSGSTLRQPMAAIRTVTVDAAGNTYIVDSVSQHVVKLDVAGHYLTSWGGPGTASGRFGSTQTQQGPMGIAAAPNGHIYVADTWNHRVQEFTATGAFVRAFGGPNPGNVMTANSFYGPRQLAVAPNGNIYVADTGNERIQVYSPQGAHLFNIGAGSHSVETALGRFDEPSGVAVDKHGIVYVADYWDKRIQRFSATGTPIAPAFPINGWASIDYGEPYLAVDNAGHLFATDAPTNNNVHVNHVLELDAATGRVVRAFGTTTSPLISPSGIAVGPNGALFIADVGAVKLYQVQP